jgi:hypothetical protein
MRSNVLRLYVAAIVVAAGVAIALLPAGSTRVDMLALTVLILLSVVAGARPVRFVGKGNEITATHSAIICSLVVLGAIPALLTATAGLVSSLAVRQRRAKTIRIIFNCAGVLFSTAVAAHLFFALGGVPGEIRQTLFWPLFAATAAYYVLNTGLVSMAVALERGLSFRKVWDGLRWTAPSYLTGGILALGLVAAYDYQGPLGLAFGLPPIWVLLNFYSTYHGKVQEKERRISEVESLNNQLQGKVNELEQAFAEVHELRSLLPICMHCKSVRDDDNTWHQIEAYISKNYDTSFTHSLCDHCRDTHYDMPTKSGTPVDEGS